MSIKFLKSWRFLIFVFAFAAVFSVAVELVIHQYKGVRHTRHLFSSTEFLLSKYFSGQNAIFATREPGLPVVSLFISEKKQSQLLGDLPRSTKRWKKGFVRFEDGKFRKVKIRHRGRDVRNYLFTKKSWRLKLPKKKLHDKTRITNLIVPRDGIVRDVIPHWVAEEMGVKTPKVELVELRINDSDSGVVMKSDHLDESFLRNNGIMPVNIYKGENNFPYKGLYTNDLMSVPFAWSKTAENNSLSPDDKSDLVGLLRTLSYAATNQSDYQDFKEIFGYEEWVNFSAFQELVQSWHNSSAGNLRLIVDNWKGTVSPITWDTVFDSENWDEIFKQETEKPFFSIASHAVHAVFLKHSEFIHDKFKRIYQLVNNERPLEKVAKRLERLDQKLAISLDRDGHHKTWSAMHFGFFDRVQKTTENRRKYVDLLRRHSETLRQMLSARPKAHWQKDDRGFSITVDGILPLNGIKLSLKADGTQTSTPDRLQIWWDADQDDVVGPGDVKMIASIKDGAIFFPGVILANRQTPTTNYLRHFSVRELVIQPTRFKFLLSSEWAVSGITVNNALSGKTFSLPTKGDIGAPPSITNRIILPDGRKNFTQWAGRIVINKTQIHREDVIIDAGTVLEMASGASLVFRGKLIVNGTVERPVIVVPGGNQPWGVFALQGQGASGSRLRNMRLSHGSGGNINGLRYTGMVSIHDTENILVDGMRVEANHKYDDMIHVIYSNNIRMKNLELLNAKSDALDVDISEIELTDVLVKNPGNDGIDFMQSEALVQRTRIFGAGDKGVSVGEGSRVAIVNSVISKSKIGVESKDSSSAHLEYVSLIDNKIQINAYPKNWRYSGGGDVFVARSLLRSSENVLRAEKRSSILIKDTTISPKPNIKKRVKLGRDVTFGHETAVNKPDALPLFGKFKVTEILHKELRGANF